jgi:hypothetical protein
LNKQELVSEVRKFEAIKKLIKKDQKIKFGKRKLFLQTFFPYFQHSVESFKKIELQSNFLEIEAMAKLI